MRTFYAIDDCSRRRLGLFHMYYGPEFLGEAFVGWCEANGVLIDYIEPGKPNQNAFIERFNKSYRTEALDTWLFRDLGEVRELSWAWMLEYN